MNSAKASPSKLNYGEGTISRSKLKPFSLLLGLAFLCSFLIQNSIYAQNIAITDDDGYTADESAMLDVKSTSKGMLVPRMDSTQRVTISNPATGLLLFDTDANAFYYYNGTDWLNLTTNVTSPASAGVNDALFSVVNSNGDTVFAVYPEGVQINVGDGTTKAKKGGFAVGGLASGKLGAVNYLTISRDSARIYVDTATSKGNKGGFAVGGLASGKEIVNHYLTVSDDSIRVYIDEGTSKAKKGGFAVGGLASGKANTNNLFYVDHDTTAVSNILTAASNIIVGGEIYDADGGFYSPTDTITDYDGNVYQTVLIGNQIWMAENLRTTHYADGTAIPKVITNTEWENLTTTDKAYCWYTNDSSIYAQSYGALYTWAAVMNGATSSDSNPSGVQGVCPDGWHLPSDDEWKELEMYLGMSQAEADNTGNRGTDEGGKLKEESGSYWEPPNTGATNESGFTAIPGGFRNIDGVYYSLYFLTAFFSSTEYDSGNAWSRTLTNTSSQVERAGNYKKYGFSVRCLKD